MSSLAPRLRIVAINDVYEVVNLPRVQTFLSQLSPKPTAVVLAGDFLSPSTLSSIDGGRGMVVSTAVLLICFIRFSHQQNIFLLVHAESHGIDACITWKSRTSKSRKTPILVFCCISELTFTIVFASLPSGFAIGLVEGTSF